jgi:hypothetical protein
MADDAEIRSLIQERVRSLAALSWQELDRYGERTEDVTTTSGIRLRLISCAYWDMEAWASGMELCVKAYPSAGLRRWFPYVARGTRGGPGDPVPQRPE